VKEQPNRRTVRLKGYDYSAPGAYFLTICVEGRRCLLSQIVGTGVLDGPQIKLLQYGTIADKIIGQLNDHYESVSVESYVIMPNHIHILLQVQESQTEMPAPKLQNSVVSRFVSTFKRFCNKEYGRNIWQPRSYDHIIRDKRDYDKHPQYIYENPYAWEKDDLYAPEQL